MVLKTIKTIVPTLFNIFFSALVLGFLAFVVFNTFFSYGWMCYPHTNEPCIDTSIVKLSGPEIMEIFYKYPGAEDQIMDPLIISQEKVLPLVIEKVADKNMHRRRYAIRFLGISKSSEALPVLVQIVDDESEVSYIRGDALEAIYLISSDEAEKISQKYVLEEYGSLSDRATKILTGNPQFFTRSYEDAMRSIHY